jgi:hypothetical protein
MFSEGALAYQGFGVSEKRTEREIDSPLRFENLLNNISVTYHLCFFCLKKHATKRKFSKLNVTTGKSQFKQLHFSFLKWNHI